MIKKILDWILGKNDKEAKPAELTSTEAAQLNKELEQYLPKPDTPSVETIPVVVKQKYKTTDLQKMKKMDLEKLVKKHKLTVKSRSTKAELIDALKQV